MAFLHGTSSRIYMGSRHLSGEIRNVTSTFERNLAEAASLLDSGMKWVPGMTEGNLEVEGFFQSDTGGSGTDYIHETIKATRGVDNGSHISIYPAGTDTIGNPAFIQRGETNSYEIESSVDDVVTLSMEAQSDNSADWGVMLANANDVSTSTDHTSVDNGASTSNGGVGMLHVTQAGGTSPSLTVTLEHSSDNSTFTTLGTFDAATGLDSDFIDFSGTVNQYVRAAATSVTGTSPSFDYVVAFARR